jgi:hypothetical protein
MIVRAGRFIPYSAPSTAARTPADMPRTSSRSLAEYVVAVNADVRDVDVLFVGQPDSMTGGDCQCGVSRNGHAGNSS